VNDKKRRRTFSAEQKVAIVKGHLIDKVPVSELCEEHCIQPTLFYQWQKALFENGAAAFERKGKTKPAAKQQRRIVRLEEKLVTKNEVIAELMEENVKAKKANGEL
jgi:transposase